MQSLAKEWRQAGKSFPLRTFITLLLTESPIHSEEFSLIKPLNNYPYKPTQIYAYKWIPNLINLAKKTNHDRTYGIGLNTQLGHQLQTKVRIPPKLNLMNQQGYLRLFKGKWMIGYFLGGEITPKHLHHQNNHLNTGDISQELETCSTVWNLHVA